MSSRVLMFVRSSVERVDYGIDESRGVINSALDPSWISRFSSERVNVRFACNASSLVLTSRFDDKRVLKKIAEEMRRLEQFFDSHERVFVGFDLKPDQINAISSSSTGTTFTADRVAFTHPHLDRLLLEELKKFAHKMERRPRTEPPFEFKTGVPPQIAYRHTDEAITFNNTLPRGISWDFSLRSPDIQMQRVISSINRTNEGR